MIAWVSRESFFLPRLPGFLVARSLRTEGKEAKRASETTTTRAGVGNGKGVV